MRQLDAAASTAPRPEEPAPNPTSTIETPVEQLDLETVIKLSQAISSEILLDRLDRQASPHRTCPGRCRARGAHPSASDEPRIEAEALTAATRSWSSPRTAPATADRRAAVDAPLCPEHPGELILNDATVDAPYDDDPYFRGRQVRSVLCLPLINQVRLIGFLYFENNLAAGVFAPARTRGSEAARLAGGDRVGEYPASTAISQNERPRSSAWWMPTSSASVIWDADRRRHRGERRFSSHARLRA